jgi:hypothetical protein
MIFTILINFQLKNEAFQKNQPFAATSHSGNDDNLRTLQDPDDSFSFVPSRKLLPLIHHLHVLGLVEMFLNFFASSLLLREISSMVLQHRLLLMSKAGVNPIRLYSRNLRFFLLS